ncbi:MAG: Ig-like domain-containing protein [Chitinophagaceae bacterium]
MTKNLSIKIVLPGLFILSLLSQVVLLTGCANIIPPVGGPRDSIPPVLVFAKPADSARSFAGKKIVFEFNEFIQLDNITENLLVSPTPKINPIVESKLRNLTITIKDTLEPNTTYTYNFGNGIKDVNENNVLRNFSYSFSTGSTIDLLQLSGKVILAESGKSDSTLIAVLYRSGEDSLVYKEKPRYITRLDKEGNFNFRNLPTGTFYLYAFKDEGGSKRYLSKSQLFAFADSAVLINGSVKPVTLYAFAEKEEVKRTGQAVTTRVPGNRGTKAAADTRLRIETNLENGEMDLLKQLEVYFRLAPLKDFDSSKIIFTDDKFKPITNYSIVRDTGNTKLTLNYAWTENTGYALLVDKDFAMDTAGRKLTKTDTLLFRTKKQGAYGLVRLRFPNLDLSKNPVLQFVQSDEIRISYVFTSKEYVAKLFIPGEYDLRILYDENKNGKWDAGQFFGTRRQPEKVVPVTRRLTVKANWDNEIDINL